MAMRRVRPGQSTENVSAINDIEAKPLDLLDTQPAARRPDKPQEK
jgi:hypothetical protein